MGFVATERSTGVRRLVVAVLVLPLVATACTADDDRSAAPTATAAPTTTEPVRWEVTETADGVEVDAGSYRWAASTADGLALSVVGGDGAPVTTDAGGLFVVAGGEELPITSVDGTDVGDEEVAFSVTFGDATAGTVTVSGDGPRRHHVAVEVADGDEVTGWGTELALADGERIYGLTERLVDDLVASEIVPEEVGSLDRRGEEVTMWVTPTMSGYVPFHQSSQGYGLLVDGYLPGAYEVGVDAAPDVLRLAFEWDPDDPGAGYHLLYGPDHPTIVRGYSELTGFPRRPPDAAFGHWRGRDEYPIDDPVTYDSIALNASVASDLEAYDRYDLPAGVYHFDRPWAVGQEGFGSFEFDPERFPDPEGMLEALDERGWQTMVWVSPWAIGERGEEAQARGLLAPGSDRALDLTDPEAVAWLRDDVTAFLASPQGRHVDGFFMDRGDEPDVTSDPEAIYADGRNGREVHNWYPVAYAEVFRDIIDETRGDDGLLIARAASTGSQASVMRWGGDHHSREGLAIPEAPIEDAPSTDLGLRSVLISLQRAAFMGTPYWGSDIGGYTAWLDPDTYARWIQVGFASPLMRFHGMGGTPWATTATGEPDPQLIDVYRRYVRLRHDPVMLAYLSDAAAEAAETAMPMARPLVFAWPDVPGAQDRWDQWLLGPDLLVAPVWEAGRRERTVWIPPGEWVDLWDRDTVVEGPTEITVDVPLDRLPMWVRPDSALLDLEVPQ